MGAHLARRGVDLAPTSTPIAIANPEITTTIAESANPNNFRNWAEWVEQPIDDEMLGEIQEILSLA